MKGGKTRGSHNPKVDKVDNVCKQVIVLSKLLGEAVQKLDEKFSAALLDLNKSSESRNAALDCTINAKAVGEVQRVCDMAAKQELHVKLSNVQLDQPTLPGNLDAKRKCIIKATPLEGNLGNDIKANSIRTIGKPREGKSMVLVECADAQAKHALFARCKNSTAEVRATPFLPKYLHMISAKFNEAYRTTPSLEKKWIRIKFNFEKKTMTALQKTPTESDWSVIETMKIPIPQGFVTTQVPQVTKSKFLSDEAISKLVPSSSEP